MKYKIYPECDEQMRNRNTFNITNFLHKYNYTKIAIIYVIHNRYWKKAVKNYRTDTQKHEKTVKIN